MTIKSDFSGLKQLQKNLEAMNGEHEVSITELFAPAFVAAHSQFADIEVLLSAAGITSKEEFEAYPDADFDAFISANTDFGSWAEMQQQGMAAYVKRQLTKGMS